MSVSINKQTATLLQAIPYFRALDNAALAMVAQQTVERTYHAGQIIFLEGEANAGLHLIVSGLCKVYRISEEGKEHVLTTLRPGDSCNEVPVVDNGPNPASFSALDDSVVWVISSESLHGLRRQFPQLNEAIIKNLAMRCRQLVQRVYNLSFLPVTGRLAAFLLQQSRDGSALNRRRWTQDEIAAHLGTVREMVGRAFRELQQTGLIKMNRHRIEIIDRERLKKLT